MKGEGGRGEVISRRIGIKPSFTRVFTILKFIGKSFNFPKHKCKTNILFQRNSSAITIKIRELTTKQCNVDADEGFATSIVVVDGAIDVVRSVVIVVVSVVVIVGVVVMSVVIVGVKSK